jgi:Phage portal protein
VANIITRALGLTRPVASGPKRTQIAAASSGTLEKIVYADVFNTVALPVTRAEAMTVPPIANARFLIAPTLGRHPLVAKDADGVLVDQPAWLQATDGAVHPALRMVWTLDDLMFTGYSLWLRENDPETNLPVRVERVPAESWDFDTDGHVVIDDVVQKAEDVILFVSATDPLLDVAARTIRGARDLEVSWTQRVRDPIPLVEISEDSEDAGLDFDPQLDDDAEDADDADKDDVGKQMVRAYIKARRDRETGAVMFTPFGYSIKTHGEIVMDLFVAGRNAAVLDVARFTGLPPALLAASQVSASLTYSTKEGSRSEFHDYSLANWALAITARLSMDDCLPSGQYAEFDLEALLTDPTPTTGPTRED